MLHSKKRIELPVPFSTWLRRATATDMLTVLPLNADAVIAVDELSCYLSCDPADRMIVATARAHDLPWPPTTKPLEIASRQSLEALIRTEDDCSAFAVVQNLVRRQR